MTQRVDAHDVGGGEADQVVVDVDAAAFGAAGECHEGDEEMAHGLILLLDGEGREGASRVPIAADAPLTRRPYGAAGRGALRLRAGIRASRGARSDAAAIGTRLAYRSDRGASVLSRRAPASYPPGPLSNPTDQPSRLGRLARAHRARAGPARTGRLRGLGRQELGPAKSCQDVRRGGVAGRGHRGALRAQRGCQRRARARHVRRPRPTGMARRPAQRLRPAAPPRQLTHPTRTNLPRHAPPPLPRRPATTEPAATARRLPLSVDLLVSTTAVTTPATTTAPPTAVHSHHFL